MLKRVLKALGWDGGTLCQVEREICRLKKVEEKAVRKLHDRIDDGCGGDVCPFCRQTFEHDLRCIYWDIPGF